MSVFNQSDFFFVGDVQEIVFEIVDDSNVAIDLTNHTVTLRFGRVLAGPTILEKTGVDFDMTDAANGVVVTQLDAADTTILGNGDIYWQLEDNDQASNPTVVAAGTLLGLTKLSAYVPPSP